MKSKSICLRILLLTLLSILISTTMSFAATLRTVTDLTVEMQDEKAYLEWDSISGATGYEVHIKIPGRGYVYAGDVSKNRVTIIGLTEDEKYTAKVRGYVKENGRKTYGGYSNEVDFGFGDVNTDNDKQEELGKVNNLKASINGTKVKLTWSNVTDAFGYEVHVKIPNRGYVHVGTVTNNSVTIVGFSNNEEYSVKIRAIDEDENYGEYSDVVSFTIGEEDDDSQEEIVKPGRVTGLNGDVTGQEVKLSWNKVSDADGYEINMVIPGYGSTNITSESTSKIITGLTSIGQNYATKVRAYKIVDGEKIYGDYSTTISVYPEKEEVEAPDKVSGLEYTQSGSSIKLSWDKVNNADGYEVAIKEPGNSSYDTFLSSGTSKTVTGLNEEGTYRFKVRAYVEDNGEKIYGDYSSILYVKIEEEIKAPSKVTGLEGDLSGDSIKLTWNRVSNVDGYEVAIKEPGNSSYDTFLSSGTSKTVTGLNEEGTYKFKVRAYIEDNGEKIYGAYSNILNIKYEDIEELSMVTGLKGIVSGSTVKLSWNSVDDADGYEIKMVIPGYGDTVITTTSTSKTVAGLTTTDYSYDTKVRAYKIIDGKKVYGEYSNTLKVYAK